MGFSRQEHWSGLPCPSPADLPDPGIEAVSVVSLALGGGFFTTSATWEALVENKTVYYSFLHPQCQARELAQSRYILTRRTYVDVVNIHNGILLSHK